MRWLGVDHGTKRVGLAVCDPSEFLFTPKGVWSMEDPPILPRLVQFCREEGIEALCVGYPQHHDGAPSLTAPAAEAFAHELAHQTGLPLQMIGEHLTSAMAETRMRDEGLPAGQFSRWIDAYAAMILLEECVGERRRQGRPLDQI
ncbi:MAG: Holliday junction resolvase RuvX [Holophagaceae bacterium]